eukprot:m.178571 g.178571  ORF g.178571 m.178571 type:complete len:248 (-) comp25368_c0_seq2:2236-2979(-)
MGARTLVNANVLYAVVCYVALIIACLDVIVFLSFPSLALLSKASADEWQKACLFNAALCLLFCFQHSIMACDAFKSLYITMFGEATCRATYSLCSSLALLVVVRNWIHVDWIVWQFGRPDSYWDYLLSALHFLGWASIFSSAQTLDGAELIGLRQAYFHAMKWKQPLEYMSESLRNLFGNGRHPIFVAVLLILTAVRILTIDRLLLLVLFVLYMVFGSSYDRSDVAYVRHRLEQKSQHVVGHSPMKR